ncbi:hypothetical protein TcWFU_009990 [Taenia crassiceps]|uniref:Uncharacterized protein n=1 Tax=Taenia crassiceps TaxID=6207 RepID=A0ABR4QBN9_9CEST
MLSASHESWLSHSATPSLLGNRRHESATRLRCGPRPPIRSPSRQTKRPLGYASSVSHMASISIPKQRENVSCYAKKTCQVTLRVNKVHESGVGPSSRQIKSNQIKSNQINSRVARCCCPLHITNPTTTIVMMAVEARAEGNVSAEPLLLLLLPLLPLLLPFSSLPLLSLSLSLSHPRIRLDLSLAFGATY